jgi:ER membrane protein complex subunit 1
LIPGDAQSSIVSGVDGQIASWTALDGRLIWSRENDLPGRLVDLNTVEAGAEGASDRKDLVAVFSASTPVVQKLDGSTGASLWQYVDSR